ncbi:MAG TPA: stage II sporulation protein M [Candidatus Methylomirabilis sp.]|nr:stage II sporulation protein M [Candidatus Methylomirabilis sp.]
MISTRWIEKRRPYWNRLEQLVTLSGRNSVASLSPTDLQELALLYRQIAADLASVREDRTSTSLAHYLNQLLGRAHNLIYMGRKPERRGIYSFYRKTYPVIFQKTLPETTAAFLLFLFAAIAGGLVSLSDPSFARHLLGPRMMESIDQHRMWTDSIVTIKPIASSSIMTNNLTVSISTFALGISAGIGTAWMLLLNGVLIGVVGMCCWQAGMSLSLWSFVAPHGVLELPAIFIAGGAGFRIARGLLFPGALPRGVSLVRAGKEATMLFLGTLPLLVIAGIIEGFVSPSAAPIPLKFLLAAVLFSLLVLYLRHTADAGNVAEEIDPFEPTPRAKSGSGLLPSSTD